MFLWGLPVVVWMLVVFAGAVFIVFVVAPLTRRAVRARWAAHPCMWAGAVLAGCAAVVALPALPLSGPPSARHIPRPGATQHASPRQTSQPTPAAPVPPRGYPSTVPPLTSASPSPTSPAASPSPTPSPSQSTCLLIICL